MKNSVQLLAELKKNLKATGVDQLSEGMFGEWLNLPWVDHKTSDLQLDAQRLGVLYSMIAEFKVTLLPGTLPANTVSELKNRGVDEEGQGERIAAFERKVKAALKTLEHARGFLDELSKHIDKSAAVRRKQR